MATTVKKTDRRVVKTKREIRRALVEALETKDIEKITIKEIAERADVDRKTVYNYYACVQDILEELEDDIVKELEEKTRDLRYEAENPLAIFEALTSLLQSNIELYTHFMRMEYNSRLIKKMIFHLRNKVRETIERSTQTESELAELCTEYVTAGLFSAYRYWFNAKDKCSLEEFSKEVAALVLEGVPRALRNRM